MYKASIPIKGMHCRSCEMLIEDELLKVPGVAKVVVSHKHKKAEVYHLSQPLNIEDVECAVKDAGYSLGYEGKKPWFSQNPKDYADVALATGLLFVVMFFLNEFGFFKLGTQTGGSYSSLSVVFLVGLTAGLSTCMAIVGGLVLGASARFAEKHPSANTLQKFKPHLFFNLGRVVSFIIFGGVIGYAGSFFQLSSNMLGILTIIVGFVMILLGAQLTELFPRLNTVSFTLPSSVSKFFGLKQRQSQEYSHANSALLGATTFFLPCGFTQAMQLYAISTGDAKIGAITMGVFALGTAPGLLGIGGLTSVVKGAFARQFFKFAGIIVIVLAVFNIKNGINLAGIRLESLLSFAEVSAQADDPNVVLENGTQIVRMTQTSDGYSPNRFTIRKGIPVKWIVNSKNPFSCAGSIYSSDLGIRSILKEGENIFEFTPSEVGTISWSCSMGMYTGVFNVVDSTDAAAIVPTSAPVKAKAAAAAGSCGSGKGGCGCAGMKGNTNAINTQTAPVAAVPVDAVQVIKTSFTQSNDIQPNRFTVNSGKPVRMEIDVKDDGFGCMGSIMIPGMSQPQLLQKGKPIVFSFTPTKPGTLDITCAMGVPRGSIQVN